MDPLQAFKSIKPQKVVESGLILISLLLPSFFNPFSEPHFELPKTILFYSIVGAMVILIFSGLVREYVAHHTLSINRPNRLSNYLVMSIFIYALAYICATMFSIEPHISFWGGDENYGALTVIVTIIFFFTILLSLNSINQIERIITALIVGSIPVALYGVIQYFRLDPLMWYTDSISPVHSTMGRSILLGAYLIMIIPFTLARLIGKSFGFENRSLSYLLILVLQIMCLFFTLARGAWIAFIVSSIVFFYIVIRRQLSARLQLCLVVGIILSIPILAVVSMQDFKWFPVWLHLRSMDYMAVYRDASNMARLITWQKVLELAPSRWLFGYGPETFYLLARASYYPMDILPGFNFVLDNPHNLFLYHLISIGVTGLFALIGIILAFYLTIFQRLNDDLDYSRRVIIAAILSSFTAYLVNSQFNADVTILLVLFWLVLGIGVVIVNLDQSGNISE